MTKVWLVWLTLVLASSGCGDSTHAERSSSPPTTERGLTLKQLASRPTSFASRALSARRLDGRLKVVELARGRTAPLTVSEARRLIEQHKATLGLTALPAGSKLDAVHELTVGKEADRTQLMIFGVRLDNRRVLGSELRVHLSRGRVWAENHLVLSHLVRRGSWDDLDQGSLRKLATQQAGVKRLRTWETKPVRIEQVWLPKYGSLVPVNRVALLSADPPGDYVVLVQGRRSISVRKTSRPYTRYTRVNGNLFKGQAYEAIQEGDAWDFEVNASDPPCCNETKRMGYSTEVSGTCAAPAIECNGVCVDITSDPNNCGDCANMCPGNSLCVNAVCTMECQTGWADCNQDPADGCEVSLDSGNNCGSCGTVCTPGFTCVDMQCVCSPSPEVCDGVDNDCDTYIDEGLLPQACYSGPAGTDGIGQCHGGTSECVAGTWTACMGEVLPATEVCGDGLDNNCDGMADEGCVCATPGQTQVCGTDVGECQTGTQTCNPNGYWEPCVGHISGTDELCDNLDNDCDGAIDDGVVETCYSGPMGTAGVGVCQAGTRVCSQGTWGGCMGEVVPSTEVCSDNLDNDCDGVINEGCTAQQSAQQPAQQKTYHVGVRIMDDASPATCELIQSEAESCSAECDYNCTTDLADEDPEAAHLQLGRNIALSAYHNMVDQGLWQPDQTTTLGGLVSLEFPIHAFANTDGAYYSAETGSITLGRLVLPYVTPAVPFAVGTSGLNAQASQFYYSIDGEVPAHEMGHAVVNKLSPSWAGIEASSVHEALADFMSATASNDSCMGETVSCMTGNMKTADGTVYDCAAAATQADQAACLASCLTKAGVADVSSCVRNLNITPDGNEPYWKRMAYDANGLLFIHESSQIFSSALWAMRDKIADGSQVLRNAIQSVAVDAPGAGLPLNPTYATLAKQIHDEAKVQLLEEDAAAVGQIFDAFGFFDAETGPSDKHIADAQENNERQAWIAWRILLNLDIGGWLDTPDGFLWKGFVSSQPGSAWKQQQLATADTSANKSLPYDEDPSAIYPHGYWVDWMQSEPGHDWVDTNLRDIWQAFSAQMLVTAMESTPMRDFIAKAWRDYAEGECEQTNLKEPKFKPPKGGGAIILPGPLPMTCSSAADCDDGNVCTADSCKKDMCQFEPIAGCCNADFDCNDGNACTTDTCDQQTHTCVQEQIPDCEATMCATPPTLDKADWRAHFEKLWGQMLESDQGYGELINKDQLVQILDEAWAAFVAANQNRTEVNWQWALNASAGWQTFGSVEVWALLFRGMWGSYVKNPEYGYSELVASTEWHDLLDDVFDGLNSAASWDTYDTLQTWLSSFVDPWWGGFLIWTGGWWETAAAQLYDPTSTTWRFWGSWWVVWHGGWDYETDPITGETTNTFIQWGDWWGGYLIWTGGWWEYVLDDPAGATPDLSQPWSLWGDWWGGYLIWTGGWWDLATDLGPVGNITGIPAAAGGLSRSLEVPMEEWYVWGTEPTALPTPSATNPETFTKENPQVWLNDPVALVQDAPPTLTINKQLPIYANVGSSVSFKVTATNPAGMTTQPTIVAYNLPKNSVLNKNKSMATFQYTVPPSMGGQTLLLLFTASNASGTAELEVPIVVQ